MGSAHGGNHFAMHYVCQNSVLCTLGVYSFACQLYLNKSGKTRSGNWVAVPAAFTFHSLAFVFFSFELLTF